MERKVILPGDPDFYQPIWTPPRIQRSDASEPEPQRPNRAQRRAMQRAMKRRNDGSAKR